MLCSYFVHLGVPMINVTYVRELCDAVCDQHILSSASESLPLTCAQD